MNIRAFIESRGFHNFIILVIILNGIVLGVETSRSLDEGTYRLLAFIDQACLAIFVVELLLKLLVYRLAFFRDGWNLFDFIIVAIALVPTSGGLSILRAFRIFRVLRLVTTVDSIRRVVAGMLIAIPGVGSVGALLMIFFYIGAVISTSIFGEHFPDWFGSLGDSMYTLFQIMTLESWSMGIVRPVMDVFPYSWLFFIPFIMVTTFMVLNLFIGIIVDAIGTVKEQEASEVLTLEVQEASYSDSEIRLLRQEITALREQLTALQIRKD